MPHSLSHHHLHSQFTRKLSVQPEETGTDLDGEQEEGERKDSTDEGILPLSFHQPPSSVHFTCGPGSNETMDDDNGSYLRKLSIASMSSVSSTCSAPGGISLGGSESSSVLFRKEESFDLQPMSRRIMTSRPSFISLCSIVSETSEVYHPKLLPAPLQVELDLMQRNGIEGDEPKIRSHLPILRCPSDYDINELDFAADGLRQIFFRRNYKKHSLVSGIRQIPSRIRKLSTDRNRFDIYSVSDETREQLKRLYVY